MARWQIPMLAVVGTSPSSVLWPIPTLAGPLRRSWGWSSGRAGRHSQGGEMPPRSWVDTTPAEATAIESLDGFSLPTRQLITDLGRTIYRTLVTRKRVVFLFVSSDYVLDAALQRCRPTTARQLAGSRWHGLSWYPLCTASILNSLGIIIISNPIIIIFFYPR